MWEKFAPMHRSRDAAHALSMVWEMSELISRTRKCRIFKLGGEVDRVHDPPCMTTDQG